MYCRVKSLKTHDCVTRSGRVITLATDNIPLCSLKLESAIRVVRRKKFFNVFLEIVPEFIETLLHYLWPIEGNVNLIIWTLSQQLSVL